jgi:dTDP-4-amino-4,6-dideoxygalactose transaminase
VTDPSGATRPSSDPASIQFIDLAAQQEHLGDRIDKAIRRVLDHGQYILGPEVQELESQLAAYCGVRNAITCASGTDALLMALLAKGIGPGDAVVVPTFTFAATAEVVALVGATPVFADVLPDTFNIDPVSIVAGVAVAERAGLRPRAVIAVDLFGQPADYGDIESVCTNRGILLIADAAQSFGATWCGRRAGSIGDIACTSFFPAKPLGCYGDGGAIFTNDDELAAVLLSIRVHGQGVDKYENVRLGINGRLDTIQAAVLIEKLAVFDDELVARAEVARAYDAGLSAAVDPPVVRPDATSAWAQYTVLADGRDDLAAALKRAGVPTAVYYRAPLHRQRAYASCPTAAPELPVSDQLAARVLSLPMHPYLDAATQQRIVASVRDARGA